MNPEKELQEFLASAGDTLTDESLSRLLELLNPRVSRGANRVWNNHGRPEGIQPRDLHSDGLLGWSLAWDVWKRDGGDFIALGEVVAERGMINGLKRLQIGAVTRDKVPLSDGTSGRFAYAVSMDSGELEAPAVAARGRAREDGDPQERIATRLDFEAALMSAGGLDGVLALLLMLADGAVPIENPELVEGLRSLLRAHEGDPRKVVESFLPLMIPSPTGGLPIPRSWYVDASLKRAASHVLMATRYDDAPDFFDRVRAAFCGREWIHSEVLAAKLGSTPRLLSVMLEPYGIRSRNHVGPKRRRGYLLEDFPGCSEELPEADEVADDDAA